MGTTRRKGNREVLPIRGRTSVGNRFMLLNGYARAFFWLVQLWIRVLALKHQCRVAQLTEVFHFEDTFELQGSGRLCARILEGTPGCECSVECCVNCCIILIHIRLNAYCTIYNFRNRFRTTPRRAGVNDSQTNVCIQRL